MTADGRPPHPTMLPPPEAPGSAGNYQRDVMNKNTRSSISPATLLLATVSLGIGSVHGEPARTKTTANDPLGTQVMPITKEAAAPGSSAIPAPSSPASATPYDSSATTTPSSAAYVVQTPAAVQTYPSTSVASTASEQLKYSDKHFVKKVAEGGQLEIALAQLAVQRASDPGVRSFAQQLVSDHTQLSQQLESLAARKGVLTEIAEFRPAIGASGTNPANVADAGSTDITRSPTNEAGAPTGRDSTATNQEWNDPTTDRHYRRLAAKSGTEFDQAFIAAMIADHEEEIGMFDKKAQKADDAEVRSFAADNLPKLRMHLEHAQQLAPTATTK